ERGEDSLACSLEIFVRQVRAVQLPSRLRHDQIARRARSLLRQPAQPLQPARRNVIVVCHLRLEVNRRRRPMHQYRYRSIAENEKSVPPYVALPVGSTVCFLLLRSLAIITCPPRSNETGSEKTWSGSVKRKVAPAATLS